jgi:hypothetical protein
VNVCPKKDCPPAPKFSSACAEENVKLSAAILIAVLLLMDAPVAEEAPPAALAAAQETFEAQLESMRRHKESNSWFAEHNIDEMVLSRPIRAYLIHKSDWENAVDKPLLQLVDMSVEKYIFVILSGNEGVCVFTLEKEDDEWYCPFSGWDIMANEYAKMLDVWPSPQYNPVLIGFLPPVHPADDVVGFHVPELDSYNCTLLLRDELPGNLTFLMPTQEERNSFLGKKRLSINNGRQKYGKVKTFNQCIQYYNALEEEYSE